MEAEAPDRITCLEVPRGQHTGLQPGDSLGATPRQGVQGHSCRREGRFGRLALGSTALDDATIKGVWPDRVVQIRALNATSRRSR